MLVQQEMLRIEHNASYSLYDQRIPEPGLRLRAVTRDECLERGDVTPLIHRYDFVCELQCLFCEAVFLSTTGRAGPCIECGVYLE